MPALLASPVDDATRRQVLDGDGPLDELAPQLAAALDGNPRPQ